VESNCHLIGENVQFAIPGPGKFNCRVTNPADVRDKKGAKIQNSFLPSNGEGNCRVTNPILLTQTQKGAKMQNCFLPGHGESNRRVTNPTDVRDKKRRENAKQFSTWPWRRHVTNPTDVTDKKRRKK
jgi:hypothetical protein